MGSFDWLLNLLPAESATPVPKGVAVGVAEMADTHGRTATKADELPHLPHLPHPKDGEPGNRAEVLDDLAEQLTERAAILEYDGGLDRGKANVVAVRIVQCSTCSHWTADPLGGGGIGSCATGADAESWSAHDHRPLSAWPHAPRHCLRWEKRERQVTANH